MTPACAQTEREPAPLPLPDFLADVFRSHPEPRIRLGDLVAAFGDRGFGLLLILFAAPAALPIPVPPGVSAVIALPLIVLASQMVRGRPSPWLPAAIARREIERDVWAGMIERSAPYLRRIDRFVHPRLTWLAAETWVGAWCLIFALSVAMPFPLSNTLPSMGIVLMSLGLIEKDGVLVLAGIAAGLAGMAAAAALAVLGVAALTAAWTWLAG